MKKKMIERSKILILGLIVVLLAAAQSVAQKQLDAADPLRQTGKVCGYALLSGFSWNSNTEAGEALAKVITAAGYLPDKFVIEAADVDNATACEDDRSSKRIILYSPSWIRGLAGSGSSGVYWARIAVLAHELGHHALGHALRGRSSTPALELEADRFAGRVLAKMNAPLDLSTAAFDQPAMCSKEGSSTHPKCADRIAAVTKGWRDIIHWVPGQRNTSLHLVATTKEGYWEPDEGYIFINPADPSDLRVSWKPGKTSPSKPHVIASDQEGSWKPEAGYSWVSRDTPGDFTVRWTPGTKILNYSHVVACEVEGKWCPETGYAWDDRTSSTNMRVHPVTVTPLTGTPPVAELSELIKANSSTLPDQESRASAVVIDACRVVLKWSFREERFSLGSIRNIMLIEAPEKKFPAELAIFTHSKDITVIDNAGQQSYASILTISFPSKDMATRVRDELLKMNTRCKPSTTPL